MFAIITIKKTEKNFLIELVKETKEILINSVCHNIRTALNYPEVCT